MEADKSKWNAGTSVRVSVEEKQLLDNDFKKVVKK